jgi:hypothetical protein
MITRNCESETDTLMSIKATRSRTGSGEANVRYRMSISHHPYISRSFKLVLLLSGLSDYRAFVVSSAAPSTSYISLPRHLLARSLLFTLLDCPSSPNLRGLPASHAARESVGFECYLFA